MLHVSAGALRLWNDMDAGARLHEGMTLQAFVPSDADLSRVVVVAESDVQVLSVGTEEFFTALERDRGFKRVVVTAKAGDTLESIGKRFDVPARTMERVNRKGRGDSLRSGDAVVVYAPTGTSAPGAGPLAVSSGIGIGNGSDPAPNGPLPQPPLPDLLP